MRKPVDEARIRREFGACVNLSAEELEAWLATPESGRVGSRKDDGESIGHASGRRILGLLRASAGSFDEADLAFMRKVVGFVRRHRAQEPANMVTSRWRYSLMNWGHDPLKE
jgi:hypothetical protein